MLGELRIIWVEVFTVKYMERSKLESFSVPKIMFEGIAYMRKLQSKNSVVFNK